MPNLYNDKPKKVKYERGQHVKVRYKKLVKNAIFKSVDSKHGNTMYAVDIPDLEERYVLIDPKDVRPA